MDKQITLPNKEKPHGRSSSRTDPKELDRRKRKTYRDKLANQGFFAKTYFLQKDFIEKIQVIAFENNVSTSEVINWSMSKVILPKVTPDGYIESASDSFREDCFGDLLALQIDSYKNFDEDLNTLKNEEVKKILFDSEKKRDLKNFKC